MREYLEALPGGYDILVRHPQLSTLFCIVLDSSAIAMIMWYSKQPQNISGLY